MREAILVAAAHSALASDPATIAVMGRDRYLIEVLIIRYPGIVSRGHATANKAKDYEGTEFH